MPHAMRVRASGVPMRNHASPCAVPLSRCSRPARRSSATKSRRRRDGGAVAMRTGTPLIVSLPPDPDTGYGWVLRSASPNLLLVGGPDYTPQPKPPGLVGVANTTAYRFRADAPGTASLEFAWQAPPDSRPRRSGWCATTSRSSRIRPRHRLLRIRRACRVCAAAIRCGKIRDSLPVNTAPSAPVGTSPSSPVKYWSYQRKI